jgi:hypothetical protein
VKTAILVPTCDAYVPVARYTIGRLDAWWPGHPEVFVCGLAGASPPFERCLPLAADPRDWVGIALDAVAEVQARGVEWLYLILDDHPPFGPCNADYLNRRLPQNAGELGAIQVNLLGWDQHQPQDGAVLAPAHLCWQRNSPSFRWKLSLHPGFWHVPTLQAILRRLRSDFADVTSARAFESRADDACRRLDPGLLERTYRVRGDGYAAGTRWFEARASRRAALKVLQICDLASRVGGARARAAAAAALGTYLGYCNGPYPMYWSGLVRQGRRHEEAVRFLGWRQGARLADEVRRLAFPHP